MEKPKCRTCHQKHWPKDGCQWVDKPEVAPTGFDIALMHLERAGHVVEKIVPDKTAPVVRNAKPMTPKDRAKIVEQEDGSAVYGGPEKTAVEKTGGDYVEPGIVAGYNFKAAAECPVCNERRLKKAAAMKRYRAKKVPKS